MGVIFLPLKTEIDWAKKKTRGYLLQVLGLVIIIVGGIGSILLSATACLMGFGCSQAFWGPWVYGVLLSFVVGLAVAWYGNQLVEKAKHVAWTKEALREHEANRKVVGRRRRKR
jgi:hypothetical protein